jgi:hypothetical protein
MAGRDSWKFRMDMEHQQNQVYPYSRIRASEGFECSRFQSSIQNFKSLLPVVLRAGVRELPLHAAHLLFVPARYFKHSNFQIFKKWERGFRDLNLSWCVNTNVHDERNVIKSRALYLCSNPRIRVFKCSNLKPTHPSFRMVKLDSSFQMFKLTRPRPPAWPPSWQWDRRRPSSAP